MFKVICLLIAVVWSAMAWGGTHVVLYDQGFALVLEPRTVTVVSDEALTLGGLPQSLLVDSLAVEGLEVFATRVIVPAESPSTGPGANGFLGRYVDVHVRGETIRGRLMSVDDGVLLLSEGSELFFPSYEKLVVAHPRGTSIEVDHAEQSGEAQIVLEYLAQRLSWSAVYRAELDDEWLRLRGRARLDNQSGRAYQGARIDLVAGEVDTPTVPEVAFRYALGLGDEKVALPDAEAAFAYHRYSIPGLHELIEGTTFLPLVDVDVPYERIYRFTDDRVRVFVRFAAEDHPLPAGQVRVVDEGGRLYVGSAPIGHTPAGEPVELAVGTAFDITGERVHMERTRPSAELYRDTYRVTLRSTQDDDAVVEVVQSLSGTWTITKASAAYERIDARRVRFLIPLPAGGSAEVTYTVEWRY